ncbi:MAG: cbb3-type cytochrome c oxidase subunit I [Adhaeribacter sp.]
MNLLSARPSPKEVVLPHFAFAAASFLALAILLCFSGDALLGHYFHPKLLTLTHVAVLGWATMIIFGALYQLLPVILQVPLYSPRLALVTFGLLASGTVLLCYAFWNFAVGLPLHLASCLLVIAFLLFNGNLALTMRQTKTWTIEADFILTSGLWLLLTGLVGGMMAFNFTYPFLQESHLHYLKLHAHLGMAGWLLLLIIGVGSKLLPMFLLSHQVPTRLLKVSYYLINGGLVLFALDHLLLQSQYHLVYGLAVGGGMGLFGLYVAGAYRKRVRKEQDAGMRLSLLAIALMALPVLLLVAVSEQVNLPEKIRQQLYLTYGISLFLGFLTALILGQTFKTLPFIVWMHRYQHLVGKQPVPQPRDLYAEQWVRRQQFSYFLGFITLLAGVAGAQPLLVQAGSLFFLLTAGIYAFQVFNLLGKALQK